MARARSRGPKTAIYAEFARLGRALAHPSRLLLLDLLMQGARTVEVLAREAQLTIGSASQHLQLLRGARLVRGERRGLFVRYALEESVEEFVLHLRDLARERLPAVEIARVAYLGQPEPVQDRAELLARCRLGQVALLDVRPYSEFAAGHLDGAVHSPLTKLGEVARDLAPHREIVAYCRGLYCRDSVEAVQTLRDLGFTATRLDLGVPELRRLGFPVRQLQA